MILSFLAPAGGFLKGVPKEVWYGIAALALLWLAYQHGVSSENERWITKLEKAEAEAKLKAEKAKQSADASERERAQEFEQQQEVLGDVIDEANSSDTNALDAIFGNLPASN